MILLLSLSTGALSQTTIEGLGGFPGSDAFAVYGASPEGNMAVGITIYPDFRQYGAFWTADNGVNQFGPEGSFAGDASLNGAFVIGNAPNPPGTGPKQAYRWSASGGLAFLGTLPGYSQSLANGISDDGQIIVGTALGSPLRGFYWTADAGIVNVGVLPGGTTTQVHGISGDGSTFVGESGGNGLDTRAFAGDTTGLRDLGVVPPYTQSIARVASLDGSVIAGDLSVNNGSMKEAFRWEGDSMVALGTLGGPGAHFQVTCMSGDGNVIFSNYSTGGLFKTAVWTPGTGTISLEDYLQNRGVDLAGWTLGPTRDVSHDGNVIIGVGINPSGGNESWRVTLQAFQVVRPGLAERWRADEQVTISWDGLDNLPARIELSTDGGDSFFEIGTAAAGDTALTWRVSDSVYSSIRSRVRVSNANDSSFFALSDSFTVKGYDLTRMVADTLQIFRPAVNGWQMINSTDNMWPSRWWLQFNYATNFDPYTGQPYPPAFVDPPLNANPADFLDWPLFTDGFGPDQLFYPDSLGGYVYSPAAIRYWGD